MTRIVKRGANLLDCQRLARELGAEISFYRKTGELRFWHPAVPVTMRVNSRRKDAPRALTHWLNRVGSAL